LERLTAGGRVKDLEEMSQREGPDHKSLREKGQRCLKDIENLREKLA
jgi:hypothetical protein